MLTYNDVKALFAYDPESGALTRLVTAGNAKAGRVVDYVDGHGYVSLVVGYRKTRAHQIAWLLMTGLWATEQIDHIDGDRTNNRWSNLRLATHAQNVRNKIICGVTTRPGRASFRARLKIGGKEVLCRSFKTKEEAQELADFARDIVFGEYRRA